jgi:dienelactone hydrolase
MLRSLTWIVQIVFAVVAGLSAQAATVADFYELAKPAGDGPFPAVVLAPGCGGFHDQ